MERVSFSGLPALQETLQIEMEHLSEGLREIEASLKHQLRTFEADIDKQAEELPTDARADLYEWHSDRHWELSDVYPRIIRHSIFVTAYSFLEHGLGRLSAQLNRERPRDIAIGDLRGNGIDLFRTYIRRVHGVPFPDDGPDWFRLKNHQKIRNVLVHSEGQCTKAADRESIAEFLSTNPALGTIDRRGRIILQTAACDDLLAATRRLLATLIDAARVVRKAG